MNKTMDESDPDTSESNHIMNLYKAKLIKHNLHFYKMWAMLFCAFSPILVQKGRTE